MQMVSKRNCDHILSIHILNSESKRSYGQFQDLHLFQICSSQPKVSKQIRSFSCPLLQGQSVLSQSHCFWWPFERYWCSSSMPDLAQTIKDHGDHEGAIFKLPGWRISCSATTSDPKMFFSRHVKFNIQYWNRKKKMGLSLLSLATFIQDSS